MLHPKNREKKKETNTIASTAVATDYNEKEFRGKKKRGKGVLQVLSFLYQSGKKKEGRGKETLRAIHLADTAEL